MAVPLSISLSQVGRSIVVNREKTHRKMEEGMDDPLGTVL